MRSKLIQFGLGDLWLTALPSSSAIEMVKFPDIVTTKHKIVKYVHTSWDVVTSYFITDVAYLLKIYMISNPMDPHSGVIFIPWQIKPSDAGLSLLMPSINEVL